MKFIKELEIFKNNILEKYKNYKQIQFNKDDLYE